MERERKNSIKHNDEPYSFIIVSLSVYIQRKAEVNLANFIKDGKCFIYFFFNHKRKN